MNKNRLFLLVSLVLTAVLLAGCASPISTWPGLAADDTTAYLASGNAVYAIDLQSGDELWHYPQDPNGALVFSAMPVLTPDGQLLIGSAGSKHPLISLDPETGRENWSAAFLGADDTWVAPPLAFGDLIYAPNSDGGLYILDLQGKLVDRLELGGALWAQPASDGTVIYVASLDHQLHIIDPLSHAVLATADLGGAIPGGVSVSVGAGGVYAGSFASRVEQITPDGGHQSLSPTEDWVWGAPTLDGDTLYFADLGGNVYSLDLPSGRQNWDEVKPNGPITPSPLVVGEQVVVVTESGFVYGLDRAGKVVWEREAGGKLYTPAVNSGELILVAPFRGTDLLVALDLDGRVAWSFRPE